MVADVFGFHGRRPTDQEIDRGADALRQLEQGGRLLRGWSELPVSTRARWRAKSEAVLRAALDPNGPR